MAGRSRDHIVTGGGTVLVRVFQLLIALTVLGLAAYGLVFYSFSGLELTMFTTCFTIVGCIFFMLASTILVRLYNYWAALAFDFIGFVLWITSFALVVSQIRPFYADNYYYSGCNWYWGSCYYKRDMTIGKRSTTSFFTYRNSMGAMAALSGLQMLLFMATFISISLFIADHRSNGGHALYSRQGAPAVIRQSKEDTEMQHAGVVHDPFANPPQPTNGRNGQPTAPMPYGGSNQPVASAPYGASNPTPASVPYGGPNAA